MTMMLLSNMCILMLALVIIFAITILAGWGVDKVVDTAYKHSHSKYEYTAELKLSITVVIYILLMLSVIPRLASYLFITG